MINNKHTPMSARTTIQAAGRGLRAATGHGGLSRVIVWFFVIMMAFGTVGLVATGPIEYGVFIGLAALFLAWEVLSDRLQKWGVFVGLLIFCAGLGFNWHLPMSLGLAVIVLVLPFKWAAPMLLAIIGALLWYWSQTLSDEFVLRGLLALIQNVFLVYLLERAWRSSRALQETREELARTEVDAERTRLAGELNEVIGKTLWQVSLQTAEIRSRTDVTDPNFHHHMTAVADLIGTGLEQLELLSFEPVLADLDGELHTAESLCARLGVEMTASVEDVEEHAAELFAAMLREAITNMFKHATPTRCTLAVRSENGEAIFGFTNDGVAQKVHDLDGGSGQRRWKQEISALGGTLDTTLLVGGRYQVLARVPTALTQQSRPSLRKIERANHG